MKVILLQELKGKGGEGDVVDVAPGFANNYLMPQGIAISKNAPELSPAAFRLEAAFRLRKEAGSNQKLILWDSKYIDYPMKPDKAEYHS